MVGQWQWMLVAAFLAGWLGIILGLLAFKAAIFMLRRIHRHEKKWVLVYTCHGSECPESGPYHRHLGEEVQIGRWVCSGEGCKAMGADCLGEIKRGILTVHNGNLVPDEKAWANPPKN